MHMNHMIIMLILKMQYINADIVLVIIAVYVLSRINHAEYIHILPYPSHGQPRLQGSGLPRAIHWLSQLQRPGHITRMARPTEWTILLRRTSQSPLRNEKKFFKSRSWKRPAAELFATCKEKPFGHVSPINLESS